MSLDLLGDVRRSSDPDGRARRGWYVLPLSIAAHAAAGAAMVIIPLAAEVEMPGPMRPAERIFRVVAAEPRPPIVPPPRGSATSRAPVAPSEAPTGLAREVIGPAVGGPIGAMDVGSIGAPEGFDVGVVGEANIVIAPAPPPPSKPVPIGGDIREPKKIVDVAPVYPQIALAAGVEGIVILEATLDERGHVDRLRVLRSVPLLDEAAIQAVRQWRYTPTLLNGTPVPVLMTITVRFRLR